MKMYFDPPKKNYFVEISKRVLIFKLNFHQGGFVISFSFAELWATIKSAHFFLEHREQLGRHFLFSSISATQLSDR